MLPLPVPTSASLGAQLTYSRKLHLPLAFVQAYSGVLGFSAYDSSGSRVYIDLCSFTNNYASSNQAVRASRSSRRGHAVVFIGLAERDCCLSTRVTPALAVRRLMAEPWRCHLLLASSVPRFTAVAATLREILSPLRIERFVHRVAAHAPPIVSGRNNCRLPSINTWHDTPNDHSVRGRPVPTFPGSPSPLCACLCSPVRTVLGRPVQLVRDLLSTGILWPR